MKSTAPTAKPVPRLNSLRHRLEHTPAPDDESYLDQLMMFLDDPSGTGDRWKKGAQMCAAWGITTTGPSVYRLYQSHAVEWRTHLASATDSLSAETPEALEKVTAQTIALRIREILSDPDADPATIVSIARLELQRGALELARQKHADYERDETERALDALDRRAFRDSYADFILREFKAVLERKPPYPTLFPVPPSLNELMKSVKSRDNGAGSFPPPGPPKPSGPSASSAPSA
jgi:hypothetical protein